MPGTHIIICGGISVNDKTHDAYPFNFINPSIRRAMALKSNVTMLFYAPSYERRVQNQKNEHRAVDNAEKNKDYFTALMSRKAREHRYQLVKIRSKDDLTAALKAFRDIATIDYFGHSNDKAMFLEYGSIDEAQSKDFWQAADASNIKPSLFAKGAVFASYGCNQGDPSGLCRELREVWRIDTIGSYGKTDYENTGPPGGPTFPHSANYYVKWPAPQVDKAGNIVRPLPVVKFLKHNDNLPPS